MTGAPCQAAPDRAAAVRRRLDASAMRIADRHPFLGALLLMAPVEVVRTVATAATDGRRLLFNPAFVEPLGSEELDGLVLHELLHCVLLHAVRRGDRDPARWNIAADIQVNAIVRGLPGATLPAGAVEQPELAGLATEEIYDALGPDRSSRPCREDLLPPDPDPSAPDGPHGHASACESHWSSAIRGALAASGTGGAAVPEPVARILRELLEPQVDWRSALWRFVSRTPDDFRGHERRHLWRGLYLDALESEHLAVDACIDTSGSVSQGQLDEFASELRGMLRAYPGTACRLYCADNRCTGPFPVDAHADFPIQSGGGGTDFRPFFAAIAKPAAPGRAPRLAVYLTDGFGTFPAAAPPGVEVVWIVTPCGLPNDRFPFGHVIRMVDRRPPRPPRVT